MGLLGDGMGFMGLGPEALDQDFSFNLSKPKYRTNTDLLEAIKNLNQQSGTLNALGKRTAGAGDEFMQQYRQMLDPRSAYNRGQYSLLRGQVGDAASDVISGMNRSMAARGIGGGGLSSLLGGAQMNRAGEQVRQGMLGIQQQSLANAGQFGNLGVNAYTGAGNMYGQAGSMYGMAGGFGEGIDTRTLQNQQVNADQQNAYNQYLRQAQYNQDLQNQNAASSFNNSLMNMAMTGAMMVASGGAINPATTAAMGNLFPTNLPASSAQGSDYKLKKNIKLVGRSGSGINVYEFEYKDKLYGLGRYRGVMAQEVPHASIMDNGYLKVDYSKIDVNFERIV